MSSFFISSQFKGGHVILNALTVALRGAKKGFKRPRSRLFFSATGGTSNTVAAGRCMHGKHHRE